MAVEAIQGSARAKADRHRLNCQKIKLGSRFGSDGSNQQQIEIKNKKNRLINRKRKEMTYWGKEETGTDEPPENIGHAHAT